MNTSTQRTIKPYSGQAKELLHRLLTSKQPLTVATDKCAMAIQTQAWLLGQRVSRRKQPCGAFLLSLP